MLGWKLVLLVGALGILLPGCGSGPAPADTAIPAGLRPSLAILPESFQEHARGEFLLETRASGNRLEVKVLARDASGLKALYLRLSYEPEHLSFLSGQASGRLAAGGRAASPRLLELTLQASPGEVVHGQVLARPQDCEGFSGDGVLATFVFARSGSSQTGVRHASLAPATDASRTVLSLDEPNASLVWRYYNQGDYDQNGEVNITDLTPLGVHFSESGPFAPDSIGAVIDGDGNGEINLGELTPIGLNFGRRVLGYRVYESLDPGTYPGNNTDVSVIDWRDVAILRAGDAAAERLSYGYALGAVLDGAYYWVRPFDGEPQDPAASEGTPSNLLDTAALNNEPPVADLVAHPALGMAPLPVQFFAGGSADPDGTIVLYEWDFDGDGVYDESGVREYTTHIYDTPGAFISSVRVTDDHGASSSDGVLISAGEPAGWRLSLVVRGTPLDICYAAALVNGRPAVAISSYNELLYCQAADAAGAAWDNPVAVPANPVRAGSLALAELGGRPAVVYAEDPGQGPHFIRAADAAGTAWGASHEIAGLDNIFQTRLILTNGGRPVVAASVLDAGNHSIQVMLATDDTGLLWGAPIVADSGAVGFMTPDLELVGALPAMTYMNAAGAAVYSPSSGAPDGSAWNDETVIDDVMFSGLRLAEINGRPAVVFVKDQTHLVYVRADDAAGTSWANPAAPDPAASLRFDTALAGNAGVPVLAYVAVAAGDNDELRFVRGLDADGEGWEAPQAIGTFDHVGQLQLLELGDGRPALVFQVLFDVLDPRLRGDALYIAVPE